MNWIIRVEANDSKIVIKVVSSSDYNTDVEEKVATFLVISRRLEGIHIKSKQDDQYLGPHVNLDPPLTHELFDRDDL
jgi:hypothetical protein